MTKPITSGRLLAALFALGTLGAIAWYAYWMLPQRLVIPGFLPVFLTFFGGLALPYLVTLAALAWSDGRHGLRFALGTALVNALWMLPLAALLVLFGGFTMGNRDQEQSLMAVAAGACLQVPLLIVAGAALRRSRDRGPGARPLTAAGVWMLAFLLPVVASGGSFLYANRNMKAFQARSAQAAANSHAAHETVQMLQRCLSHYRASGYPASIDACTDASARMSRSSGYQFDYLPSLPGSNGLIGAYLLRARPISFRATGFDSVVADSVGSPAAGAASVAASGPSPDSISLSGAERAVLWCAYAAAAQDPSRGYPHRLLAIAPCVAEQRPAAEMGGDRLNDDGKTYIYLSDAPDAGGRTGRFRIYRPGLTDGGALWIDDQMKPSGKKRPVSGPIIAGLPDLAVPERFAPGCTAGRGDDCFVAGQEWQRKARQAGGDERGPQTAPMREAAIKAFERGCELNNGPSCSSLASERELGNDAPRDVMSAALLYEKACSLGYALGCRRAGEMYESGRKAHVQTLQSPRPPKPSRPDLPRDAARAVADFGRACELDDLDACFIAGRLLAAGEGIAADREGALAFFARACDDGMALACSRAADLSPQEEGEFRRRACAFGDTSACGRAGR